MTEGNAGDRGRNLVLVALLAAMLLLSACHEGYLGMISPLFWAILGAGVGVASWLAWSISCRRLTALILSIFVIEFVKETIGIRSGMWSYHGHGGQYTFGVWAWVLGGVSAYAIATRVGERVLGRPLSRLPVWTGPLAAVLVFAVMLLALGEYRQGAGVEFWVFYAVLLAAGLGASARMRPSTVVLLLVSSWIVGNPSEYAGSVGSGVWTFTHSPDYPPAFLLFGCWPLEILAQYSLSAYLASEPLGGDRRQSDGDVR